MYCNLHIQTQKKDGLVAAINAKGYMISIGKMHLHILNLESAE